MQESVMKIMNILEKLISMINHPGHDIYVVLANNKELLIPVVPEIIKNIDHTNKKNINL